MESTLKLPLAGARIASSAAFTLQGEYGFYWASSPNWTLGYNVSLSSTKVTPATYNSRANGFSVRCLKN